MIQDDDGRYYRVKEVEKQSRYDHANFNKEYAHMVDKKNEQIATLTTDRDTAMSQLEDAEARVKRQAERIKEWEGENKRLSDSWDHSRIKELKDTLTKSKHRIKELESFKAAVKNDRCSECPFLHDAEKEYQCIKELEAENNLPPSR